MTHSPDQHAAITSDAAAPAASTSPRPAAPSDHPTIYIIDGYAQFFRAYHAIRTPMSSPVTKEPTNMTFGFVGMLLKLLRGEGSMGGKPAYLLVTIDKSGDTETFRSTLYPDYKAHRPPPPDDLFPQVDRCLKMLEEIGVPIIGLEGFEADDCIATLVKQLRQQHPDLRARIVSKDKDLKQLLATDRVEMFDIHTDILITQQSLKAETGLEPAQVVDMLALMGDTADNVPGVPGVGPKTAVELISAYGTMEHVIAAAREGKVKGKRGESIQQVADRLPLSKQLVMLRDDVPMDFRLDQAATHSLHLDRLIPILRELGFGRYQDDVRTLIGKNDGGEPAPASRADSNTLLTAPTTATSAKTAGPSTVTASKPAVTPRASRSKPAESRASANDAPGLFDAVGAARAGQSQQPGSAVGGAAGSNDDSARGVSDDTAPFDPSPSNPTAQSTITAGAATRGTYRCVLTERDLADLLTELTAAELFAVDTETTGLSPLQCDLVGLSFSTREYTGWYVPVRSPTPDAHLNQAQVLAALKPLLEDASRAKCGHNLKFDMLVLRHAGINLAGVGAACFDSMVSSYLIDSSRSSHGMDSLALALLGHTNISIKELIGSGVNQRTFDTVPLDLATQYAGEDADITLRLTNTMQPQLRAMGLWSLFRDVEMPLVEVLTDLEFNGIRVDADELDRQRKRLEAKLVEIRSTLDESAMTTVGRTFNPDSPKQLAAVLFNSKADPVEPGLGLKPVKKTKTGNSTDVEVLETLAEDASVTTPIPRLIVDHRQLSKLVGTYLVALKEAINPDTGRVHASFNQTVAATGRLSSSDPNLQNIPIRTDLGREIRKAFIAPPGRVLISADYSQIELRLLAHLSRDPALIEAFKQDQDIHTAVAAQINHVDIDKVTKEQRSGAKMVNFGIVYGVTPFGLARRLGIPNDEAAAIIDGYKRRFAGITTFLQECVEQARRFGYVETMLKRRRMIPDIFSNIPARKAFAERTAINSVVQGSAADLIKLAMVDLNRIIHSPDAAAKSHPMHDVKMLLQIHDELVFESPASQADAACKLITDRMEAAMSLSVPLKADAGIGSNWFDE